MDHRLPILSYDDLSPAKPAAEAAAENSMSAAAAAMPAAGRPAKPKAKPTKSTKEEPNKENSTDKAASKAEQQARTYALQELGKERRRRAFVGMLKLLEHGASDAQQLHALIAPMSDEELLQIAEERSLAGKCGNPLCTKPFVWQEPRKKYFASADNIHKLEGDCYCSRACASFVQQLAVQLVDPMARIRPTALQKYLARPSHRPQQGVAAQGGGVETMKAVIEEHAPYQLIHEAEEAGKQLDAAAAAAAAASGGDSSAAAAVEGYVPRKTPSKQPKQQQQQQDKVAEEPMEVLQLQPVLKTPPAATAGSSEHHQARSSTAASGASADVAPATIATGGAGTSSSSGSGGNGSLDGMLHTFREIQDRHLQQINQQHDHAMDVTAAGQQAAAAAAAGPAIEAAAGCSSAATCGPVAAAQPAAAAAPQSCEAIAEGQEAAGEGAAADQPPRRRRTVTFAPDVSYSCPTERQEPPEQPVLTFTLHDPGSPLELGSSSSSGGGLVGELQLTSAQHLDPELAAAAAAAQDGQAGGEAAAYGAVLASSGDDVAAGSSTGPAGPPPFPEVWKLYLPPALGGVGVPVKQLVKTRPMGRQQQKGDSSRSRSSGSSMAAGAASDEQQGPDGAVQASSAAAEAGQSQLQQQQKQQEGRLPATATALKQTASSDGSSLGGSSTVAAAAALGPAPGTTSYKVQAALKKGLAAAGQPNIQQQQQPLVSSSSSRSSSSSGVSAATTTGASTLSAGSHVGSSREGAAASRLRKFTPNVRPSRSVVVLEHSQLPGVAVKQRGVRTTNNSSTGADAGGSAEDQQQQQQQQQLSPAATTATTSQRSAGVQHGAQNSSTQHTPTAAAGVVSTAVNGNKTVVAPCSSSSSSSDDDDSDHDGSEAGEQKWDHETEPGGVKSRSGLNGVGRQQLGRGRGAAGLGERSSHGNRDSGSSSEEEEESYEEFGDQDDEPWTDEEGGGLGLEELSLGGGDLAGEVQSALAAVLPFLDTKGVTVHLSEFGLIWNTLHAWISPATLAYVNTRQQEGQAVVDAAPAGCSAGSSSAEAAEGPSAAPGGVGEEDSGQEQVVPSRTVVQQRGALATLLGHALPLVVEQLGVSVPQPELSRHLHALVRTFYMPGPLPALQGQHWQLVVGLLLAALSAWRLPLMRPLFAKRQQPGSRLEVMLAGLGSDVDRFRALLDLFELDV